MFDVGIIKKHGATRFSYDHLQTKKMRNICQSWGRGFESHRPLQIQIIISIPYVLLLEIVFASPHLFEIRGSWGEANEAKTALLAHSGAFKIKHNCRLKKSILRAEYERDATSQQDRSICPN
jgi:hypothetical protein